MSGRDVNFNIHLGTVGTALWAGGGWIYLQTSVCGRGKVMLATRGPVEETALKQGELINHGGLTMRYFTTGLAAVALLAIVIFSIQNLEAIEVSFLIWSATISKCVVMIGTYLLGMVSGWGLVELFKKFMQN